MKNPLAAVLFKDRAVMWCEFDVVSEHVVSGLYDRPEDVSTNPPFHPTVRPRCGHDAGYREKCVVVIPTGHGAWWAAQACRTCVLLTHGHHPLQSSLVRFATDKREAPSWVRVLTQRPVVGSISPSRLPGDVAFPEEWFRE